TLRRWLLKLKRELCEGMSWKKNFMEGKKVEVAVGVVVIRRGQGDQGGGQEKGDGFEQAPGQQPRDGVEAPCVDDNIEVNMEGFNLMDRLVTLQEFQPLQESVASLYDHFDGLMTYLKKNFGEGPNQPHPPPTP
ncbi:unnamed protein product, partial [Ilex paraguariensis]